MINFPDAPVIGEELTVGVVTYRWDGVKWDLVPSVSGLGGTNDIAALTKALQEAIARIEALEGAAP